MYVIKNDFDCLLEIREDDGTLLGNVDPIEYNQFRKGWRHHVEGIDVNGNKVDYTQPVLEHIQEALKEEKQKKVELNVQYGVAFTAPGTGYYREQLMSKLKELLEADDFHAAYRHWGLNIRNPKINPGENFYDMKVHMNEFDEFLTREGL